MDGIVAGILIIFVVSIALGFFIGAAIKAPQGWQDYSNEMFHLGDGPDEIGKKK